MLPTANLSETDALEFIMEMQSHIERLIAENNMLKQTQYYLIKEIKKSQKKLE